MPTGAFRRMGEKNNPDDSDDARTSWLNQRTLKLMMRRSDTVAAERKDRLISQAVRELLDRICVRRNNRAPSPKSGFGRRCDCSVP
jgi:hypothetical protein